MRNYIVNGRKIAFALIVLLATGCRKDADKHDSFSQEQSFLTNTLPDSLLRARPFSIQVAAFTDKENARKLARKLDDAELPVFVTSHRNIMNYPILRVLVGPFQTSEEAEHALGSLKNLGYSEAFMARHSEDFEVSAQDSSSDNEQVPGMKRLTFTGDCSQPQWSPTGREIAFFMQGQKSSGIYAIGTGGGSHSRVVESDERMNVTSEFCWSPDGEQIAFVAEVLNRRFEKVHALVIADKAGNQLTRLVEQEEIAFQISGLSWSPDSRHIAFNANYGFDDVHESRIQDVLIVPTSHSNKANKLRRVTRLEGVCQTVGWQTNNMLLYLADARQPWQDQDRYEVWHYSVDDRKREAVLTAAIQNKLLSVQYLAQANLLLYSVVKNGSGLPRIEIRLRDLSTGGETLLLQTDMNARLSKLVSAVEAFYFIVDGRLWIISAQGKSRKIDLKWNSRVISASPSGGRICLVKNGDLFIIKLTPK